MAIGSTIYTFDVSLSDADRDVYRTLSFRVARHPSETDEFLLTRVLAYCLEYTEGLAFSAGLSDTESPALAVRDLTGRMLAWIEVGLPDAARLHKAAKSAARVAVYPHRDAARLLEDLAGAGIHRAETIEVHLIDRALVAGLAARLARRQSFDLAISDRHLYLTVGAETLTGAVERRALGHGG